VAFDCAAKRAVVLLSDTALTDLGGLGMLGEHLLDSGALAGTPRTIVAADAGLIDALVWAWSCVTRAARLPSRHQRALPQTPRQAETRWCTCRRPFASAQQGVEFQGIEVSRAVVAISNSGLPALVLRSTSSAMPSDKVIALTLKQGGPVLRGDRH
jgi:hypothetical protein